MTTAKIRPATPLDVEAIAELHSRVWQATYGGSVPQEFIDRAAARRVQMWTDVLAEPMGAPTWLAHRDGVAVGFAHAIAVGAGEVRPLELTSIYLDVAEQGRGTADNLMLMSIGDAPAFLHVWDANDRAIAFYRRHGFAADGEKGSFGPIGTIRMVR